MANSDEIERKLEELNTRDDIDPEEVKRTLNEYSKALASEFTVQVNEAAEEDPDSVRDVITDFFRKNVSNAAAQVVWLMSNAESETVRLNAAKMVITIAREQSDNEGDPLKQLLSELTKKKPVATN